MFDTLAVAEAIPISDQLATKQDIAELKAESSSSERMGWQGVLPRYILGFRVPLLDFSTRAIVP